MVICLERGANDLHIIQPMPLPPHQLAPVKSRMVYLSGAGLYPDCPEKRSLNGCSSIVSVVGATGVQ